MRVNNKMNSLENSQNDGANNKIKRNNIHEQFINLANKMFLQKTPTQMKPNKKRNIIRNNMYYEHPFNHSIEQTENNLFYENFMVKLNINNYKQGKNPELFPNQTVLNSQKQHLLSKTPQLLSGKKLIPSLRQTNNSNNTNSIRSIKTSKVYSNPKNTFNGIKKTKQTSFRFTYSPYLGSVPKGTRLSPRNATKNSYLKINNNPNQKVKSISFSPIENNQLPIKNEVLKIYAGKYDKKNNYSLTAQNNETKLKNNSNINTKFLGNTISTSKTQKTINKDVKVKKLNNTDNDVKIISKIITEDKENKKKNKFKSFFKQYFKITLLTNVDFPAPHPALIK